MTMNTRVMVEMMREHLCRESYGTYVQHKGRATPRHKADGHVSSKKEHGQQKAAQHALSPTIKGDFTHTLQHDSRRNGVCGICQLSHDFCHSLRADGVDLKVAALAMSKARGVRAHVASSQGLAYSRSNTRKLLGSL
jgi:hypothetical protein